MENKMENKNKRYTFGGYTFGSAGFFQLLIQTRNYTDKGTIHGLEVGLELSAEERQELITILITLNKKEDN
jgi:hypothetical protein